MRSARERPEAPAGTSWPELRRAVVAWYRRRRRDLPWRRTDDPYAVWVSEIMLQQTRVQTVLRYYDRFLERFPTVADLARASVDDVLAAWTGLGYYRRARALHEGARRVVERHGGQVPSDPEALRTLPGVGRYTAGAIASIAWGLPEPVLDGNVRRVLGRLLGLRGDPSRGPTERTLWAVAAALVRGRDPGDLNQALMELGATVCTPRAPACETCPWRSTCAAFATGDPERFPASRPRRGTVRARVGVVLAMRAGRVLLERPDDRSPLRGTWDLPALELGDALDAPERVRTEVGRRHRIELRVSGLAVRLRHGILHRVLDLEVYPSTVARGRIAGRDDLRWVGRGDLERTPVSGATVKVLAATSWRG